MTTKLGHVRRALLLALAWAALWAPLGILTGLIVDPTGSMDEPWIAAGVYPGFLSAIVFSVLLRITEGRRKLDELSVVRAAAWGALSGLLVIVIPFTALVGTPNTDHFFWRWRVMIIVAVSLLAAISAAGTVLFAKRGRKRELRDGNAYV